MDAQPHTSASDAQPCASCGRQSQGYYQSRGKRVFDILGAMTLLLMFAVPMFCVGLATCFSCKGRVFYSQVRAGQSGRPFRLFKFCSMVDGRVTLVGKITRPLALDELPQFVNVILGQMSLVGPRPHLLEEAHRFVEAYPPYGNRVCIRPGMTGLAQVRGLFARSLSEVPAMAESDLEYLRRCSLPLDLLIMLRTVKVFFRGH